MNLPRLLHTLKHDRSIAGLGFTTTVNAQLLTVPVYFVAAVSYIILGYLSDKYKNRSTFLLIALSSCLIGYIILLAAPQTGVRYFGVFMVAIGLYATTSLNIVWAASNHAGYFKRAFATGSMQLVGSALSRPTFLDLILTKKDRFGRGGDWIYLQSSGRTKVL